MDGRRVRGGLPDPERLPGAWQGARNAVAQHSGIARAAMGANVATAGACTRQDDAATAHRAPHPGQPPVTNLPAGYD